MDARRSPQRIFRAHPPDQRAQVRGDLRSASKGAGFPTPVPTEAGPMLTDKSLRSDDGDGLEDPWKPSIQLDQEQAITVRELGATAHPPLQHNQLMSECRVLCLKSALRLDGETNRVRKKQSSAIIPTDVRRFGHVINKDGVFGTHTHFLSENSARIAPVSSKRAGALKQFKRIALREDSPELRRLRRACTCIHFDQIRPQGS
jgi:hypothetical protein